MTEATEPHHFARGSRFSARLRILAWIVLTATIGVTALIITVNSALSAKVARDANDDVTQEISEFVEFAGMGVDPETAKPFASTARLMEVFLGRQHAGDDEVFIGRSSSGSVLFTRGQGAPEPDTFNPMAHEATRRAMDREPTGVIESPVGQIRYARTDVTSPSGEKGSFYALVFTEGRQADVSNTTWLLTWVGLGVLLLTAAIAWLVAGQILRPVRDVRQAAATISEQDLTRRIPVRGRDDIAALGTTFNRMLDRLESAFSAQQRFVDDASHELRTPITIVRGHLEVLSEDPAERQATISLVTDELDRMSRIVNDLLSLAQAERPDFIRVADEVDVAELTVDLDAKFGALGRRRWVLADIADGTARLDPQRVTQAVLQLGENAVQHTHDGDTIRLASRFVDWEDRQWVEFSVTDSGPGIAQEDAERIFERFARASDRQAPGAGLGLAIVRAIAEGHEGHVFLESEPGAGSTFGIRIPWTGSNNAEDELAGDETQEATTTGGADPHELADILFDSSKGRS